MLTHEWGELWRLRNGLPLICGCGLFRAVLSRFFYLIAVNPPESLFNVLTMTATTPLPKLEISNAEEEIPVNKFYQLAQRTRASINSSIYAATGIKLDQKKLIISFLITLVRDFAMAYTVRGSLKLIPKLLKMLQILK